MKHFLAVFALLGVLCGHLSAAVSQPNILVLLADDFGLGDVSCYGGKVPTPALDRLAKEGMRFTQFTATNWVWSPQDKVKRWDRTAWMVDRTLEFMRAHTNQPCFVNLWLDDTHTPWVPKEDGAGPSTRQSYTAVLKEMDHLFPTLCAQAGAALPKGYVSRGEDFSRTLRGQSVTRTKPLFWEYGRNKTSFTYPAGTNRSPNVAVRDGNWKLLVNVDGSGAELYDLATDPKESKNLSADKPDVARRLSHSAVAWRKSLP